MGRERKTVSNVGHSDCKKNKSLAHGIPLVPIGPPIISQSVRFRVILPVCLLLPIQPSIYPSLARPSPSSVIPSSLLGPLSSSHPSDVLFAVCSALKVQKVRLCPIGVEIEITLLLPCPFVLLFLYGKKHSPRLHK